jgi:hypothetical protein
MQRDNQRRGRVGVSVEQEGEREDSLTIPFLSQGHGFKIAMKALDGGRINIGTERSLSLLLTDSSHHPSTLSSSFFSLWCCLSFSLFLSLSVSLMLLALSPLILSLPLLPLSLRRWGLSQYLPSHSVSFQPPALSVVLRRVSISRRTTSLSESSLGNRLRLSR